MFQSFDQSGQLTLSRRELGEGLEKYGLRLTPSLVTLVFDSIAEGYKLGYDEFKDWFESYVALHMLWNLGANPAWNHNAWLMTAKNCFACPQD